MTEIFNQLAEIRLKKSLEYNKKIAIEEEYQEKINQESKNKIAIDKEHQEKNKQETKNKIEEEQIIKHNKYLSNLEEMRILESIKYQEQKQKELELDRLKKQKVEEHLQKIKNKLEEEQIIKHNKYLSNLEESEKQLEEMRILESIKYQEQKQVELELDRHKKQKIEEHAKLKENQAKLIEDLKKLQIEQSKTQLEEITLQKNLDYKQTLTEYQKEQFIKNKLEQTKLSYKHEKLVEQLENSKIEIKESGNQVKKAYKLKNLKGNKKFLSYNHGEIINYGKQNNDQSFLDDSFVIIFCLFDHDNYEEFNTQDFVKSIIDNFYNCVNNTELNNLYIFYISIKEICTTLDNIDIQLIISSLDFIKMDYHFIDVLNKSNKLEHIRVILKEFVKIIDKVKTFL